MGPAPHSPPQAIDNHADDTEMFPHLQNMIDGAPTPENVLPDVDPCKSVPRRLPVAADDSDDDLVQAILLSLEVVPDDTDADLVQAIVQSLEEVPDDTDADIVQATVQSLEDVPDDTDADLVQAIVQSLEEVPDDTDADLVQAIVQSLEEVPDDTDADLVQAIVQSLEEVPDADLVQQPILQNVEEEENNRHLHNSSNISLVLSMNNHRPSNMSGINSLNLRRDSSAQHLNEAYDFSQGDFLEINDLIDSPSAFSSENFCITSRNSEEHLNPEALLHEFETPSRPDTNPETNPRNVDCMLSVAATQGSRQVLIEPPASGSIGSCSNDMHTLCMEETSDYATKISMQRKQGSNPSHSTASVVEERSDRIPSKRGTASHEVSQGPSTSQDAEVNGKGKAVSRIAKFKKKYCCFIPFF